VEYHEPYDKLSDEAKELHRAISSLIEELEAVNWYHQRADVTTDEQLKRILIHNRDEEVEHAAMALEWLRRKLPVLDDELREILFKDGEIVHQHGEHEAEEGPGAGGLGLGSLKEEN
jgi:ferritin-like protein